MNKNDKIINFLVENKLTFDQLIKCIHFWDFNLSQEEQDNAISKYLKGKYDNISGWY